MTAHIYISWRRALFDQRKRDGDGELKQTRTFICHSAIILGEARSLNNDNWKRVIQFHDKDNTLHRLLIPYEHFMGKLKTL
jgi:hypothetical protein